MATNNGEPCFEDIRDAFFYNPKTPDESNQRLADAAALVLGAKPANPVDAVLEDIAVGLREDYTTRAKDPNHLSVDHLLPSGNIPASIASAISNKYNNNTVIKDVSGNETPYEQEAVDWLNALVGYDPDQASGLLVSGGTLANLTALLVARLKLEQDNPQFVRETFMSRVLKRLGLGRETFKGRPAVLFGSAMGHYSLKKAVGILGATGTIKFEEVPLEERGYIMDPEQLEKRLRRARRKGIPVLGVVAVAGETETGLVDDLDAIADIIDRDAEEHNGSKVFMHVDAAYGGPFILSRAGKKFKGIERADSVTIDPHKYMYAPYPSGAVLFRDAENHALLRHLNAAGAGYLFQHDSTDNRQNEVQRFKQSPFLGEKRIEGSMGGQAAATAHTIIHTLGREGLRVLLDHDINMTRRFVAEMSDFTELIPAHMVELNSICFRPNVDQRKLSDTDRERLAGLIRETRKRLEENHGIAIAQTDLPCQDPGLREKGIKEEVFRMVFTNPYTGREEVEYIAEALKKEWDSVTAAYQSDQKLTAAV